MHFYYDIINFQISRGGGIWLGVGNPRAPPSVCNPCGRLANRDAINVSSGFVVCCVVVMCCIGVQVYIDPVCKHYIDPTLTLLVCRHSLTLH